jgi:predicted GIY-YIG superfamily endonuclease
MYHVYILQSKKDGSYYTGMTEDVEKRLQDHNWHEATYSKSKAPFELVWYCSFKDKKKTLDFEKYLKSGSGFAFARKRLV